ncbi:MAG: hypothetical protein KC731_17850, partial [Myxococcales bacterium]|nr:hypothetical protein [Myxococcales bacterium]
PYYMSPEQVYGDEVDGRTDIYSLGAVMFRALTGTYPFDAKSPMGMFTKHLTEAPPSAVQRAPELSIPQGVSDAIQKCMAKEPAERFQTIDELRDVLIDELQALPQSSSDRLLISDSSGNHDSAARAARRKRRAVVALPTDEFAKSVIATREELERYERKLRRTRYGAWTLLGLVLAGAVVGGGYVYAYRDGKVGFAGREREPNDTAADATVIPLDREVEAFLGRRLEAGKGDRDFFRFEVPEDGGGRVAVSVGSLPNMSMCSVLYRVGFTNPVAQYCTGSAGVDLEVAAVRLDPGSYLLAVSQDLTRGDDGKAPPIYENVSDSYEVRVRMATPSPTDEVEPNDDLGAPQILAAGGEVQGALAWLGDVDVFCVDAAATAPIRWQIEDGQRPRGTVLEAVAVSGDVDQPLIRVHPGGVAPEGRPHLEADVMSPWTSPSYEPRDRPNDRRCLRVTLTRDPWAETTTGPVPSTTSYRVRALLPEPEGEPPRE